MMMKYIFLMDIMMLMILNFILLTIQNSELFALSLGKKLYFHKESERREKQNLEGKQNG